MRNRTLLASLAVLLSLFASTSSQSWAQDRLPQAIAASSTRVAVQNTVVPRARAATDLGPAAADQPLESLSLRFNMTDAQSAALARLLANQQNPASAQYHQWLTPEQFGAQFGLSQNDLTSVTNWLEQQGFTVTGVARGRTFVTFTGSVGQVNQAFGVTLHNVSLNGEQHIANLTDPVLPAPLANVVGTVTGLNDFRLKPRIRSRKVQPDFYGGATYGNLIAPGDFYTLYDLKPLFAQSINGAGVTIAVTGQTDISQSDYSAFRTAAGLSANNPPVVQLAGADPGIPSSDDFDEAMLDVEWAGAVAPGASILYVNGKDIFLNAVTQAIDNKVAPIVTASYGDCEPQFGNSEIQSLNALFQQANAQGQTMLGPAGDDGAADCESGTGDIFAQSGLAVDFPASSPYVTGVGGTEFNEGGGTYWTQTDGANGGTALSYIPEQPWNDAYLVSGGQLLGVDNGGGGGGGVSQFFSKPAWQTGPGVPADASRDVPDIAFSASADHDGYLVCASGDCTNGFAASNGSYDVFGGTSVSTPSFAGVLALLEQKLQSKGLGNVNPNLYGLLNSTYYNTVFHDITSGSNAMPCELGSTGCASGYPGFNPAGTIVCPANSCSGFIAYPTIGYSANTGYDLTTGLGSIDVANLADDWLLASPVGVSTGTFVPSTVSVSSSSTSFAAGTSVTVSATIASGSSSSTTAPTGTATLLLDNVVVGSPVAVSGGTVTFPAYATASLVSGPHTFSVSYSGDATYAGSKGSIAVDVTSTTAADFSLTPATASVSVATGGTTAGTTYTVTPLNGFTGDVSFTASTNDNLNATYDFSVSPVVISGTTPGTTILTLQAYVSNNGAARPFHPSARRAGIQANPWALGGSGIALAGLILFTLPRRRRNGWSALAIALVSAGILSAAGCSGNSGNGSNGNTNTTPGTYTITVTATGQNAAGTVLTHNATLTFIVTN